MYCYKCGNLCDESDRYCRYCGTGLQEPPAPKKGTIWIPLLIIIILSALGISMFFALPYDTTAAAESGTSDYFSIQDGILFFDRDLYAGGSELIIPESVGGQTVLALADGCFENCTTLTSITLPGNLETIGKAAFRGCTALRGIQIPESVTRIGIEAFYGCSALEAISVTDSLEYVGPGAFGECNQLYYIMFSGLHQDWVELYDEFITPYTGVFCENGSYYQGKPNS